MVHNRLGMFRWLGATIKFYSKHPGINGRCWAAGTAEPRPRRLRTDRRAKHLRLWDFRALDTGPLIAGETGSAKKNKKTLQSSIRIRGIYWTDYCFSNKFIQFSRTCARHNIAEQTYPSSSSSDNRKFGTTRSDVRPS